MKRKWRNDNTIGVALAANNVAYLSMASIEMKRKRLYYSMSKPAVEILINESVRKCNESS